MMDRKLITQDRINIEKMQVFYWKSHPAVRNLLTIILIFCCSILMAQNTKDKDYFIISGKITNVKEKPNGKKSIDLIYPYSFNRGLDKIDLVLNEDGYFKDTIHSGSGLYYIFDSKNVVAIYLKKTGSYNISYDKDNFENNGVVLLGGDDLETNKYYVEKMQKRVYLDRDGNIEISEAALRLKLDTIQRDQLSRLEKSKISPEFRAIEIQDLEYDRLAELQMYLTFKKGTYPDFVPSKKSVNELNIEYNNEEKFKNSSSYSSLVDRHYSEKLEEINAYFLKIDSSYSLEQDKPRVFDSIISNKYIKDHFLIMTARFDIKRAPDKDKYYRDFNKYYTGGDEAVKAKLYDIYMRFTKYKKGVAAPEFINYKNYSGGTNSLKDFRGKFIYIDIWATWCGNCWNELPNLIQMEEDYKDKNLVFISVSVDKYETDWIKVIKEKELKGVQLFGKDKEDVFLKEFVLGQGIPRYIIIDPNGNLIDYNAPRPSEKEKLNAIFESCGL